MSAGIIPAPPEMLLTSRSNLLSTSERVLPAAGSVASYRSSFSVRASPIRNLAGLVLLPRFVYALLVPLLGFVGLVHVDAAEAVSPRSEVLASDGTDLNWAVRSLRTRVDPDSWLVGGRGGMPDRNPGDL